MATPALSGTPTSTPPSNIHTPNITDPVCTTSHALYCFDVLVAHFEGRRPVEPPFPNAKDRYALFVTWNTSSNKRANAKPALRGCIGNFSPMPLSVGLADYALVSALEDHRFSPIKLSELPLLSCNVSLLTPMTPISDPLGWIPGEHGIHITFPHPTSPSHTLSATYLPEICPEQSWTKEQTVLSAIAKAGFRGKVAVGDKVWQSLKVKVYGSVKAGATWAEYVAWKKGNGEVVQVGK